MKDLRQLEHRSRVRRIELDHAAIQLHRLAWISLQLCVGGIQVEAHHLGTLVLGCRSPALHSRCIAAITHCLCPRTAQ